MTDAFISYSRKDQELVRRLNESLAARGKDAWVDWEDIPLTAKWRGEAFPGVEPAHPCASAGPPGSRPC